MTRRYIATHPAIAPLLRQEREELAAKRRRRLLAPVTHEQVQTALVAFQAKGGVVKKLKSEVALPSALVNSKGR